MLKINGEIFENDELKALIEEIQTSPEDMELEINSPGGDAMAAFQVCNAIAKCGKKVTCKVQVIAASAAAVIALSCPKVQLDKNCIVMLHNCWTFAVGNKEDLKQEINAMETIDTVLQNIVSEHCKDPDTLKEAMDKGDVWMTGEEVAEMFDNVELVEVCPKEEEGKKVAKGGLGQYLAALRKANEALKAEKAAIETENTEIKAKLYDLAEKAKAKPKAELKPEPKYEISDELKALLEMRL